MPVRPSSPQTKKKQEPSGNGPRPTRGGAPTEGTTYGLLHFSRGVLGFGLQVDGRRVFHDPLDRHLDELVEGIQLLPHQPLLVKIGAGDQETRTHLLYRRTRGRIRQTAPNPLPKSRLCYIDDNTPDDDPAGFLPQIRRDLVVVLIVLVLCTHTHTHK